MYNILLDKLPETTRNGLKIRADFRESIKFELLMQDRTIDNKDKIKLALNLYYYNINEIKDIKQAIDDILWFYRSGKELKNNVDEEEKEVKNKQKQIYSYEFDADYIYSAFMEQYKIDLNNIKFLHSWKFKALNKIKDKEMKKFYKKMKKLYALPDMRTEEEKESDFAENLW